MGVVASWGSYTWAVNAKKIKTFHNYTRKTAYKTEQVENEKNKPGTARVAPELITLSMSIFLSRDLGVDPRKELEALRTACEAGEPRALILGGIPVGKHSFLLKSVSEKDAVWGPAGGLIAIGADLEFEEYVKEMAKPPAGTESTSGGWSDGGGGGGGGGGGSKTSSSKKSATTSKIASAAIATMHVGTVAGIGLATKTIPAPTYTGSGGGRATK